METDGKAQGSVASKLYPESGLDVNSSVNPDPRARKMNISQNKEREKSKTNDDPGQAKAELVTGEEWSRSIGIRNGGG